MKEGMKEAIVVLLAIAPFMLTGLVVAMLDYRDARNAQRRDRWRATQRNIARLERELGIGQ